MGKIIQQGYEKLLVDIKERIRSAQYEALKAVNKDISSIFSSTTAS